uniref:Uncharacterized protein n=1 Tax=Onchocerca volvulus TaxID=6282 RepID=A0A8R1XXU0_ONCVO
MKSEVTWTKRNQNRQLIKARDNHNFSQLNFVAEEVDVSAHHNNTKMKGKKENFEEFNADEISVTSRIQRPK